MNAAVTTKSRPTSSARDKFTPKTFHAVAEDLRTGRTPLPRITISDDRQPGLRAVIRNTGLISYHVQYIVKGGDDDDEDNRRPYLKIGNADTMSVDDARELTKTIRGLAEMGIDPVKGLHERLIRELQDKGLKWRP